ncbi:MAG: BamA/TamA family outer membrane protein [Taibaiella sp.]|nr:BamA/TamA family outer membrane protein [Taibaiella sp.]
MNRNLTYTYWLKSLSLVLALWGVASCASYKNHLPEKDTLYIGSKLKVIDSQITERSALEEELKEAIRPKPNKKIFGLRFKLGVYNTVGEPKSEKGMRKYLRDKIGEPPVLGSTFNLGRNQNILYNKLQNNGYFSPEVRAKRNDDSVTRKTSGEFEIIAGKRKYFRSVDFLEGDTSDIAIEIRSVAQGTLIKKGNPYFLDAISAERNRIDLELKNKGYYYFSPDFLIARIDTGLNADSLDVHLTLKYEAMQPKAFQVYHIKDIYINSNYIVRTNGTNSNRRDTAQGTVRRTPQADTINYELFNIVKRREENFKPFLFKSSIAFKPGDVYSRRVQNLSLNRLVSLNAFKFIKNDMVESYDSTGRPMLSAIYLLTPYPSKSLNLETSAFSQNDSRVGSRVSVGWRHRNILKGAEQLEVKLTGGFEMQYGGDMKIPNLYQGGIETNLTVPRLLFARSLGLSSNSNFVPKSNIKLGYNYYLRETAYRLNTFNLGLGYQWKEAINKDHKLYPINITYVRTDTIGTTTDYRLSNILFNGVIIGPTYQFTYNSIVAGRQDLNFFFDGLVDLSGNILGIAQGAKLSEPSKKIFGANFAQYVKLQTDFRVYKNFGKQSMWASRLFLGAGYAYGNSYSMPNVKQFFVGGASSLRGFRSRMLGPGTYHQDSLPDAERFLELLGDIKLEANTEFRFPIYSTWAKGAVFADAGNIWLWRDNPEMPGGKFSSDFLKQIAVNGGIGLRFDFSIIVLRTDFGIPLRKPWYEPGNRWVIDEINFGSPKWRRENIIFNLAIGYPF